MRDKPAQARAVENPVQYVCKWEDHAREGSQKVIFTPPEPDNIPATPFPSLTPWPGGDTATSGGNAVAIAHVGDKTLLAMGPLGTAVPRATPVWVSSMLQAGTMLSH